MIPLQLVVTLLFCVSSLADSVLDHNELRRKFNLLLEEIERNREHDLKQDAELKAVKLELEHAKKHCRCGPNSTEEISEMNEVSSGDKTNINQSGGQSKIRKYMYL